MSFTFMYLTFQFSWVDVYKANGMACYNLSSELLKIETNSVSMFEAQCSLLFRQQNYMNSHFSKELSTSSKDYVSFHKKI